MAYITLNKNNFFNNLDIITKKTKSKDKIALVLKDNAYGHGISEISQMAKEYGITKAIVQNYQEAIIAKEYFNYILVLADFPQEKDINIRYSINDINTINRFPKGTKVELKVDTGMHRNGIAMEEIKLALKKIKEQNLDLEAIFTHHKNADELTSEWFWQNENFKKIKKQTLEYGFKNLRFHSANSASLFRYHNFDEDMARVGIAAYGCLKLPSTFQETQLKPVLSLYANKISSRKLKKSNTVGYGGIFTAKQD
jgi:alanine racemase